MKKNFWNLEQFFSLFPVHLYMIDVHGRYQSCNEMQAQDFGLNDIRDIVGKTNYDIPTLKKHPSVVEILEKNNKQVLTEKKPLEFYEPGYRQNGTLTHFKSYKIPIFQSNDLMGLIGISFDLSNEAERIGSLVQKIDQTELTLNNIIDNLPEHIYWLDKENRFLGCNQNQAKDFGLKNSNEVIGFPVSSFQTKENAHTLILNNNKILKEGISLSAEETYQNPNGETQYYLSKKVPLKNNANEIVGIVGISVDITEQKKLEISLREARDAAEAANHAKTEFLANMRHDIRTPLSGIVGFAELLKSEAQDSRIQEYAENLLASSNALRDFLDEILEAVRVSSGEIPMLKKKFDLKATFEKIIDLYLAKAHQKDLELTLTIDPKLPSYVIGDKIRLHRIILELIGNALNFTDKGKVAVNVDMAKRKNRQIIIKATVIDTGIGMPKDKQQEIYLQFKRLTPSYQGIYKGAGLGLYIVKQFIDELDGEIYVESEPNKGTCFTCLLPLQLPLLDDAYGIDTIGEAEIEQPYLQPITVRQLPINKIGEHSSSNKPRILIVEDNKIAQLVAQKILSALDCIVDIASDGQEALNLFSSNTYNLIFMDIGLGAGMDGYEVTNHIRSNQLASHYTPIVALTAHGSEENKERCIRAGMDTVLTKPLTHAHAADMIKAFILEENVPQDTNVPTVRRDLPDTDEELFQLNQFALLDFELGLKTYTSKSTYIELLQLSLEDTANELKRMKQAFTEKDFALVEKIAHKLKGGAEYISTVRMKYACQYLERYCKTGATTLFKPLYYQAIQVITETQIAVKEWLNKNE